MKRSLDLIQRAVGALYGLSVGSCVSAGSECLRALVFVSGGLRCTYACVCVHICMFPPWGEDENSFVPEMKHPKRPQMQAMWGWESFVPKVRVTAEPLKSWHLAGNGGKTDATA